MTFTLNREAAEEVVELAKQSGIEPTELIGIALRILKATAEAPSLKRKVLITSSSGYPINEIVIPKRQG
jgi:hypothetical protein